MDRPLLEQTIPVKIAIVISSMRTGGKEHVVKAICDGLDRQRFDPFLCVMNAGELLDHLDSTRVYSQLWHFKGDLLGFAWRLWQVFRQERPQIVYCLSYRIPGWLGRGLGKLLGVPVIIYELHGVEKVGERDLDWLDRNIFDCITDHMIAIGDEFRQNLLRDGVAPDKITVIQNGIDTTRFAPCSPENRTTLKQHLLGLSAETTVIGCITKMRPKKNLPLLIEAFSRVVEQVPNVHLVLVGDGSERGVVEAKIAEYGLGQQVYLLGLRQDVADLINTFDVLALSSTTEAAPLVILEAGACGIPVVSTNVGEIADMIVDGQTGYLVSSGDAATLANRLVDVLANADLRAKMGTAARNHILKNFGVQTSIEAREKLFLRLLNDKQKRS